ALNYETKVGDDNVISSYGSVISPNSQLLQVEAATVWPPNTWNPDEAFVYNIYQAVLYRPPTKIESENALRRLASIGRTAFVNSLLGYDDRTKIFNRLRGYSLTTAMAFSAYSRLGLSPAGGSADTYGKQSFIVEFIKISASDDDPVGPIPTVYSDVPDSPWTATQGMALAFQRLVFNANEFREVYPDVTGLQNTQFSSWLSATMFPGRSAGGVDEAQLITMMNNYNPGTSRQGAAAAFRSAFAAVLLASGYDPAGSKLEQLFQRQLATAVLYYQLAAQSSPGSVSWQDALVYGQSNPYSSSVAQTLLTEYTAPGGAVAVGGAAASYQGVFGLDVPGTASKAKAGPRFNGEIRISTTSKGGYSATVTLGNGTVYRHKGQLQADGSIVGSWAPGISVNLSPVDEGSAKYFGGAIVVGSDASEVVAGRMVYSKSSPFAGPANYTLSLLLDPVPSASERLQGSGFAAVKIPSSGTARLTGRLSDNTAFTASIPVWGATGQSGQQALLVHRALNKGAGSIGGIIEIQGGAGTGDLAWKVAPSTVSAGREIAVEAVLSPYYSASSSVLPSVWRWNAPFSLDWGNGSAGSSVSGAVGYLPPTTLYGSDGKLLLKINKSSGFVSGAFTDSLTGSTYKINAILDQQQGTIDGFFLTPQSSGSIEVNR
ncbi:MAG: hypothetical protein JHC85_09415, partial [Chthoniobacterales bacterium]|nr:hypothetical protein [Chthoniobacterales bacterium]